MDERPNPSAGWLRTKQGIGVVFLLALGAYFVYLAFVPWAGTEMRDGFTLAFFPVLGAGLMALCAAVMTVDSYRKEAPPELAALDLRGLALTLGVVAGSYGYFELMLRIGFLLATPVFLFALMFVLGLKAVRSALGASLVMTLIIYGLFRLIGVTLPQGILPF